MTAQISAIIPTYNAAGTIDRTLASVFAQTKPVDQIICIDDCSTDNTRARLAELAVQHPRIHIIHADMNRGPSHARNLGIEAATGDWLAILDADDACRPERMAHMLEVATEENAEIVLDNIILHDGAAGIDVRLGHQPSWSRQYLDMATYWLNNRLGAFQYSNLKMFAKKSFFKKSGVRYPDELRYGEDMIMMAEALAAGARSIVIAEAGYIYTTRIGAISRERNSGSRSRPDFMRVVAEIDGFSERHTAGLDAAARRAIAACRGSFVTAAKANDARSRRDAGDYIGYLRGIASPSVITQILTVRWRNFYKNLRASQF